MRNGYIRLKNKMPLAIMADEANKYRAIKKAFEDKTLDRFILLETIEKIIYEMI